jgi:hypothetical protein
VLEAVKETATVRAQQRGLGSKVADPQSQHIKRMWFSTTMTKHILAGRFLLSGVKPPFRSMADIAS